MIPSERLEVAGLALAAIAWLGIVVAAEPFGRLWGTGQEERMQLIAADLQGIPMMVTTRDMTEDEWIECYCKQEEAPAERS